MLKRLKRIIVFLVTMVMVVLVGCGTVDNKQNTNGQKETLIPHQSQESTKAPVKTPEATKAPTKSPEVTKAPIESQEATKVPNSSDDKKETSFEIHFIDCGQGDSIFLRSEGQTMLIDAANNSDGNAIVSYLKKQGVEKLDYVVGTHPDADHIGGLDTVINSLKIGKVYLPKKQNNTKTFEDVLIAINNKGLKISAPKPGTKITLGGARLTILGPINYYDDDNNNNSIVIRAVHGENSFMLTGDAGLQEETDIMEAGENLEATVLKVGHHGSNSSTSRFFLEKVEPKYAVISCGVDNKYGHPHKETLDYLDNYKVKVFRTDLEQTIIMKSDGKNLEISTGNPSAKGSSKESGSVNKKKDSTQVKDDANSNQTDSASGGYIGNKNSKKFHLPDCKSLPLEKNRVYFKSRKEAINEGYDPCKICNP